MTANGSQTVFEQINESMHHKSESVKGKKPTFFPNSFMCQDGGRLSENSEASEGGFYVPPLFYIDFTHMKKTLKSQIVRTKESVASARAKLRK